MGATHTSSLSGIGANLAPDAFRRWAEHYVQCESQFSAPQGFSPVPYFLLARAIELALKAKHLENLSQDQVKDRLGHYLDKAYEALAPQDKILNAKELKILRRTSNIYATKGFEYFEPGDALAAFSRYPDLTDLRAIAAKLCT